MAVLSVYRRRQPSARGGAEVAWECARFYYSYAYFNPGRQRYEILDVTGPDEYHERVHNNAFTNAMVKKCLSIALEAMAYLQEKQPWQYEALLSGSTVKPEQLREMHDRLYVPHPAADSRLIEQFDRYYMLEDLPLAELQSRMLNPQEYLGGGNGLATTTQILKQADVVLLLHLFSEGYDRDTKRANWEYYEPRTEHGSSLSSCIYALVAADIGIPDWAYPYFMRTATIDLTGDSKQYVGDLYIGGTHPAANGELGWQRCLALRDCALTAEQCGSNRPCRENGRGWNFRCACGINLSGFKLLHRR